ASGVRITVVTRLLSQAVPGTWPRHASATQKSPWNRDVPATNPGCSMLSPCDFKQRRSLDVEPESDPRPAEPESGPEARSAAGRWRQAGPTAAGSRPPGSDPATGSLVRSEPRVFK